MRRALDGLVDDFWSFDLTRSPEWKWVNGDRLIARWHRVNRERLRTWRRLFIVQWDMLVSAPVDRLLDGAPQESVIFTGRLDLGSVKTWWNAVKGRRRFRLWLFRIRLLLIERYIGDVFTAPFVVVGGPREYFDRLATTPLPTMGFIEYRCPTLGAAWGFPHWTCDELEAWRPANPATRDAPENRKIISAARRPVSWDVVRAELTKPGGYRVFHPIHEVEPDSELANLLYACAPTSAVRRPPDQE